MATYRDLFPVAFYNEFYLPNFNLKNNKVKAKLILIVLLATIHSIFAQTIEGSWKGELDVQGTKLPLIFHIQKDTNGYKSNFDSPMQGAKAIPIEKTTFENGELTFDASNMGITYRGKVHNNKIEGNFSQNGFNLPLNLTKTLGGEDVLNRPQTPKAPFGYDNEEVTFKNEKEGNLLAGTLTSPKNFIKKSPILVMITGSGAQNRDEELFGHKPFMVIADDFAKKGIATLRMDDRGIGGSEKGKMSATTENFAGDISSAVNFLVKRGYTNIGLIGHSEGGMIAPMVANANKNVKFLVLMAAPGIPTIELLQKQSHDLAKAAGAPEETLETNEMLNRKIYSYIINYKGKDLKTDIENFLIEDLKKLPKDQMPPEQIEQIASTQAKQVSNPWFQYFIKFNPDVYLSKVKIPVLAINGGLDLQVSAKENLAGIKKSLTKGRNTKFETEEFPGLNHLFQNAKTGAVSEYGQIEETIATNVLDKMSEWILKNKK